METYINAMRPYADFQGRMARRPFWVFQGLVFGFGLIGLVLDGLVGNLASDNPPFITALILVPHYVPLLASAVRRLHDTGRSGWWILLAFVPLGVIVVLIFQTQPTKVVGNPYGGGSVPA